MPPGVVICVRVRFEAQQIWVYETGRLLEDTVAFSPPIRRGHQTLTLSAMGHAISSMPQRATEDLSGKTDTAAADLVRMQRPGSSGSCRWRPGSGS